MLGIFAIVLSLTFSIQFVAAGSSGAAIITAIIFCLITEFAKVVFTHDCMFYWETDQGSKALFSALLVVILFSLSISAAVFVLTISPAKQQTMINQSDSIIETLQTRIAAKQSQLAACNPSFVSKCVNPRTSELNALQSELDSVLNQSGNVAILEAKANAEFWKKTADYLGSNPNSLQLNFAIARAVLLDLLGLILISQYTANRKRQELEFFAENEKVINSTANHEFNHQAEKENQALLNQIEQLEAELQKQQQENKALEKKD